MATIRYTYDEIVLPVAAPTQAVSDSPTSVLTLAQQRKRPQGFADDDLLPVTQAVTLEQEDSWAPSVQSVLWLARPFADDELALLLAQQASDSPTLILTIARQRRRPPPYTDDDLYPTPFTPEQEDGFVGQTQDVPWFPAPFRDDEFGVAAFALEQEAPPWQVPPVQSVPWMPRPASADEIGAALANFGIDQQDDWNKAVQRNPWLARPFADPAEAPNLVQQASDSPTLILTLVRHRKRPHAYTDDEALSVAAAAPFYLEQEEPWRGAVQTVLWLPRPFADDEVAAYPALADEGLWVLSLWGDVRPVTATRDDEAGAGLRSFFLEQEEPWTARVQSTPWEPLAFADDEIRVTPPANPYLEDDPPFVARVEYVSWTPLPYRDDEIGAQLKNFARDQEDYWPPRVQLQPWTPLSFADEDPFSHPPVLDDEQPYVAREQLVPWLPRPFRDDEISAALRYFFLEQEEPWTAQTQLVHECRRVFSDDDIIQPPPFGLDQEEFWTAAVMVISSPIIPCSMMLFLDGDEVIFGGEFVPVHPIFLKGLIDDPVLRGRVEGPALKGRLEGAIRLKGRE